MSKDQPTPSYQPTPPHQPTPPDGKKLQQLDPIKQMNESNTDKITFDPEKTDTASSCMPSFCGESSHPFTALVHICYKIFLVFLLMSLPLATSKFNFIAIMVVAAAIDFWITKNIAGRKLVGLRWWIQFSNQGEEEWRFQSRVDERFYVTTTNETVFWWTFHVFSIVWIVLIIINVLAFKVHQVCVILYCLILLRKNYSCYSKCYQLKGKHLNSFNNYLSARDSTHLLYRYTRGSIVAKME